MGQIGADDKLARCLQYATHFDGDQLTEALLFGFNENSREDGTKRESLVWRVLAPQASTVHDFGCTTAANYNARRQPAPERRRYYCGFKEASAKGLSFDDPEFSTEVDHCPEDGFEAHAEIILRFKVESRSAKASARTAAGALIARALGPATPHICADAADDDNHPIRRWGPECLELKVA